MKFNKKTFSNLLFLVLFVLIIYPKTRIWILRQVTFSPKVEKAEKRVQITNYHWLLQGINTGNHDFKDSKEKVSIVNFWATWCAPCVAEMPSLQALYDVYGDRVNFFLVTSESKAEVLPFLQKHNYTLPVYNENSPAPKELFTESIPRTFLIDKKGTIVIDAGIADWNTRKTRKLLEQLLSVTGPKLLE